MLSERAILRYNEVRGRTEIHRLSQGLTIGENDQGLLTIFGGEGGVTDGYTDLDDREENTLWDELCAVKPVIKQHLQNIINSNYVPAYHPFRYYLEHLPPWTPDKGDAIMGLSLTVNVKGDADEQILFYQYLKKWLVAMVASWVEPRVVNNVMLILIGVQGSYKTTWFAHLLPPQLRDYFYTKTDASILSKDDRLVLAQYGLMCWEELDSMLPKELNKLKGTMTMPSMCTLRALPQEPPAPGIVLRHGQQRAVPVGHDGDAPMAALRGGVDRAAAGEPARLRRHLCTGLHALPAGLPLLVRPDGDTTPDAA